MRLFLSIPDWVVMELSEAQIEYLSWLAKIKLTDNEKKLFLKQLNDIVRYFKELDKLNLENVEPMYHVLPLSNVFREDVAMSCLNQEEALRNAPKKDRGFIRAPKI